MNRTQWIPLCFVIYHQSPSNRPKATRRTSDLSRSSSLPAAMIPRISYRRAKPLTFPSHPCTVNGSTPTLWLRSVSHRERRERLHPLCDGSVFSPSQQYSPPELIRRGHRSCYSTRHSVSRLLPG